jgi:CheY-like chemotaxis protein
MARLLLIEDDDDQRDAQADVLRGAGHEVAVAANGLAGVEAARGSRPDLVLCDVNMPGLDGYGVLAAIRADPGLAPVQFLFLTGLSAAHHGRAAMGSAPMTT